MREVFIGMKIWGLDGNSRAIFRRAAGRGGFRIRQRTARIKMGRFGIRPCAQMSVVWQEPHAQKVYRNSMLNAVARREKESSAKDAGIPSVCAISDFRRVQSVRLPIERRIGTDPAGTPPMASCAARPDHAFQLRPEESPAPQKKFRPSFPDILTAMKDVEIVVV